MSDSDDTDVLLLIPPDLFIVPSSDSEEGSEYQNKTGYRRQSGVVSEILEHVQSLESRLCAIESKDNSLEVSLLNASLDSQAQTTSYPLTALSSIRQTQPQTKFSLNQLSSLPNTPVKPRHCSSVHSSPGCHPIKPYITNTKRNVMRHIRHVQNADLTNPINTNSHIRSKHDELTSFSEPSIGDSAYCSTRLYPHNAALPMKNIRQSIPLDLTRNSFKLSVKHPEQLQSSATCSYDSKYNSTGAHCSETRNVREMELSEVDELLQEMEATEIELAKRINSSNSHRYSEERMLLQNASEDPSYASSQTIKALTKNQSPMRRLDIQFTDDESQGPFNSLNFGRHKSSDAFPDISLPDDEPFQLDAMEKTISDHKLWDRGSQHIPLEKPESANKNSENETVHDKTVNRSVLHNNPSKLADRQTFRSSETSDTESHIPSIKSSISRTAPNSKYSSHLHSVFNDHSKTHGPVYANIKTNGTTDNQFQPSRHSQYTNELQQNVRDVTTAPQQPINSAARNTEPCPGKSQRLLTLSDFWDCDGTKTQDEMLRIRLEEEKFRREHCEHLIQELQKRLLEQQEKVAVAIRVDNEKNAAITQFQNAWSKMKQRWQTLEKEYSELQDTSNKLTEKHQSEITEYQQQIKRGEAELSKALDLAAGYKEKSDALVKEKLDLLKNHADELEKYKSLVQEAEQRYEDLKIDYNKLSEKNKQLEEFGNNVQQELNKERLRNSEVRSEMAVIHKALDSCEAELTILRQEKESLQLKIKEEVTRNSILEQNKIALLEAINDAKKAQQSAKDEAKSLVDRQEQIRAELREVYQSQVDEVVKTKLKEFQGQLDATEMAFQTDLDTRQRAIAECAARKIKSIIDKHQLEINLLEEKHMEEKRLGEIQLAQASQRAAMLEAQLSTQRATKTHLAEQLHSVMQKQWQQALQIISGGNMENLSPLQRLNAERIFEAKTSKRCNSACCNKVSRAVPSKLELRSSNAQNLVSSHPRQDQDESLVTVTSNDESQLMTKKESKDDLRKYIKMILDMQQPKDDYTRTKYIEQSNPSPPPVTREVPRKHYTKKENNGLSEESVTWQQIDEPSLHETSDYIPIAHPQGSKVDQHKNKPPWK